jgi:murein DD-endopeptidase MepM/ murein hydrolase activator NlpD
VGQDLKVPPRGWVIAVATAMQESRLTNLGDLGDRNDHDSLGLFQQRPSTGWGTPAEVRDPVHASTSFYKTLLKVKGWQNMRLTQAAQRVQISAYPSAYQKWEDDASTLVDAVSGGAAQTPANAPAIGKCAAHTEQVASSGWVRPVKGEIGDGWHTRGGQHQGVDLIANKGTPIYAAADGVVIHMECDRTEKGYDCSHDGSSGSWPGGCGWYLDIRHADGVITRYCHMRDKPLVGEKDKVRAGQQIGVVGSTGHSSGPHLHFEVHLGSRNSSSTTDPVKWMKEHGAPLGTSAKGGEQAA